VLFDLDPFALEVSFRDLNLVKPPPLVGDLWRGTLHGSLGRVRNEELLASEENPQILRPAGMPDLHPAEANWPSRPKGRRFPQGRFP
jgi:hypothetical protein